MPIICGCIKNARAVSGGKLPLAALGVAAPKPDTLILTLEHPAPYLPELLTHPSAMPLPRAAVEAKGAAWARPGNYVSNGPYLLKEWVPNDHITLVKNPRFYDAAKVRDRHGELFSHQRRRCGAEAFSRRRAGHADARRRRARSPGSGPICPACCMSRRRWRSTISRSILPTRR